MLTPLLLTPRCQEYLAIAAPRSALSWFEIPTTDFDRARTFYGAILETPLREHLFAGGRIAMFDSERPGVGGCLDENFAFKPSAAAGTVIYLNVAERLDRTLALVEPAGGRIAQLKTTLPSTPARPARAVRV